MNILVCTGAFKDTYTSIEFCEQMKEIIDSCHQVEIAPVCDGGEHTLTAMKYYFNTQLKYIHNIYNCYLKLIDIPYLILDKQVFLFTSEIIKLSSLEDAYKNPLKLSDYGIGQAIHYLYKEGYKTINLCIGGTSTVCCGAGAAQAMGVQFYDANGNTIERIICGEDLIKISSFKITKKYTDLRVRIIADGNIDFTQMSSVSNMKVSEKFQESQRKAILEEIEIGVRSFAEGIMKDENKQFTGAAGGLIMGIRLVTKIDTILGSTFFTNLFRIEDKLVKADIIITGEGKLDNSVCGKGPFGVLDLAKKHQKETIYIVGAADNCYLQGAKTGIVSNSYLKSMGIDTLLNCQYMYSQISEDMSYVQKMLIYKAQMPKILKNLLGEINL